MRCTHLLFANDRLIQSKFILCGIIIEPEFLSTTNCNTPRAARLIAIWRAVRARETVSDPQVHLTAPLVFVLLFQRLLAMTM